MIISFIGTTNIVSLFLRSKFGTMNHNSYDQPRCSLAISTLWHKKESSTININSKDI